MPTELMSSFAYPLTTSVIAGILGLGEELAARMRAVSEDLLVVNSPGDRELDETQASDVIKRIARISHLHSLVAEELAVRRREPTDDLLSALAHATLADGTTLEDEDARAYRGTDSRRHRHHRQSDRARRVLRLARP